MATKTVDLGNLVFGKDHTIKQRKARKEKKADGEQIELKVEVEE
jgi:hypothetical protein